MPADVAASNASRPRSLVRGPALWRAYAIGLAALLVVKLAYYGFHDVADGMPEHVPYRVFAEGTRERQAAALERSLLRAELSNLRLQLQPHFLFNALNTISSTMYDDVEAADALLGQLADLLRTSLRTTHTHEVPAREELA